jgi:hypothetical protein
MLLLLGQEQLHQGLRMRNYVKNYKISAACFSCRSGNSFTSACAHAQLCQKLQNISGMLLLQARNSCTSACACTIMISTGNLQKYRRHASPAGPGTTSPAPLRMRNYVKIY